MNTEIETSTLETIKPFLRLRRARVEMRGIERLSEAWIARQIRDAIGQRFDYIYGKMEEYYRTGNSGAWPNHEQMMGYQSALAFAMGQFQDVIEQALSLDSRYDEVYAKIEDAMIAVYDAIYTLSGASSAFDFESEEAETGWIFINHSLGALNNDMVKGALKAVMEVGSIFAHVLA